MNFYEINEDTLALLSYKDGRTMVIEKDDQYIIDDSPYEIMEQSCRYFGSSLDGRINGSKDILGSIYKIPIIVEESKKMIFFPTASINSPHVSFISYKNIRNVLKNGSKSEIEFSNGNNVTVNCPYFSMKNQIFRCNILESISDTRKSNLNK